MHILGTLVFVVAIALSLTVIGLSFAQHGRKMMAALIRSGFGARDDVRVSLPRASVTVVKLRPLTQPALKSPQWEPLPLAA
jgi:hypothetical protein